MLTWQLNERRKKAGRVSEANGATNDARKGGESGDFSALPFCVVSDAFCVGVWSNGAKQGLKARGEGRASV